MKAMRYKIKIYGLKSPEGTMPMVALKEICSALMESSERALRLSIEGISLKRGTVPKWLKKSLQFTVTGITKGSTVLEIEAPTLEASAPEKVQQPDLWYTPPDPKDTALSLLSRSVLDATTEQMESDRYDRGVLESLLSFRPFLKDYAKEFDVDCASRKSDNFKINGPALDKISRIEAKTPEPRAIILSGLFTLIEHPSRRFQLTLEDGRKLLGTADPSHIDVEQMRALWGRKVTLKGMAAFKPSGVVHFIQAEMIKPFETGEELFLSRPQFKTPVELVKEVKRRGEIRGPLMEVWGKWPGEESIDEILISLNKISKESS